MKLNEEKCHLLTFGEKDTEVSINVGSSVVKESNEEKLLGVIIQTASAYSLQKGKPETACSCKDFDLCPKKKVMAAFVISQFSFCPLIWVFHDGGVNSKSIHIYDRALRIAYQDFASTFAELIINDNSISIYQRTLQLLVTYIYGKRMNLNPSFMKEILVEREICYNLRVMNSVYARRPRTTAYGLENINLLGKNLWRDLPLHI